MVVCGVQVAPLTPHPLHDRWSPQTTQEKSLIFFIIIEDEMGTCYLKLGKYVN